MSDIYFDEKYGKLNEKHEQGKSEVFNFVGEYGSVRYMFIKRKIPKKINNVQYYDITTPYGYGGPLVIKSEDPTRHLLVEEFRTALKKYCIEQNIVSEFVRFHPIENNVSDFSEVYKISFKGKTIGTNLVDYDDPYADEFSKACRREIRLAIKNGINNRIIEKPKTVNKFMEIYYATMDRNEASEFYYFDEEYFNESINYFQDNIILIESIYKGEVVSKGFYFVYKDYIHAHLIGTLDGYIQLGTEYMINYVAAKWGKENGYALIHYGGGRTKEDDDSLLRNKKHYGKNTEFLYYVGQKIRNQAIYEQLCKMNQVDLNTEYFPAYRA